MFKYLFKVDFLFNFPCSATLKTLASILFWASISSVLTGCVTLVDATTNEPIQTDPSKRSFGNYWDDANLKTIVAVNIRKASPALADAHIEVTVYNQVVLISGEVPSKAEYELAGKTARAVNKVRQVYNELKLSPNSSILSRTNDNWLASKIRLKLMAHRDIDSGRVKVVVQDEVVFLMGKMTQVQADKITTVVSSASGISKVVRAIEYID